MNPTRPATQRVQQLIALATDPAASEEEARTAALQAARGIRQHGLVVTTPEEAVRGRAGGYYAAERPVTPRGRQLGPGTPQLPPRAPGGGLARSYEAEPHGRGGARRPIEVNLDFRDDEPAEKREPAFSAALLALLGHRP